VKSRVAIVGTRPESVQQDYQRLLALLGRDVPPPSQQELLLVLDCPAGRFVPGASSPPWQLEGAVAALCAGGRSATDLIPVAAGEGDARTARRHCRYDPVLAAWDLELRVVANESYELFRPRARLRRLTRFFPDGIPVPRLLIGRDALLLPTIRGDRHVPAGGSVAVAPAAVLHRQPPMAWRSESEVRADLLALRRELHPRLLAILDMTVVGFGTRLGSLQPVSGHVLLASIDLVALDAVAVRMMGYDPLGVDYLRLCHERSLGMAATGEIELLGQPESLHDGLKFNDPTAVRAGQVADLGRQLPALLQTFPGTRRIGRARRITADWLWRHLVGRRQWRRFAASPWGRLFAAYGDRILIEESA